MDISTIPDELLVSWIRECCSTASNTIEGHLLLAKMSDADKTTSITNYLLARVTSNSQRIAAIPDEAMAEINSLTADSTVCNNLLGL